MREGKYQHGLFPGSAAQIYKENADGGKVQGWRYELSVGGREEGSHGIDASAALSLTLLWKKNCNFFFLVSLLHKRSELSLKYSYNSKTTVCFIHPSYKVQS